MAFGGFVDTWFVTDLGRGLFGFKVGCSFWGRLSRVENATICVEHLYFICRDFGPGLKGGVGLEVLGSIDGCC